jgi:hypothetical protein
MHLSSWFTDFLNLRPICDRRFLRVVWIGYLVVEIASNLNLLWGTLQAYSGGSAGLQTWLTLLPAVAWILVQIALVRIFLEMAARMLTPEP